MHVRVRHDSVSKAFTLLALMIVIYIATWEEGYTVLFPAVILLAGFGMSYYLGARIEHDPDLELGEAGQIGYYSVLALCVMAIAGMVYSRLFLPELPPGAMAIDTVMFVTLIAVAEENLFRGAILPFLGTQIPRLPAILAAAMIFAIYHFSVYRAAPDALLYVFTAGIVLCWITARSQRLSPAILAHVTNNVVAVGLLVMKHGGIGGVS
jgi:membrane protease YdiL (CAAX protease family)